jgi:phosphoribosylpyrophosphate synthetase
MSLKILSGSANLPLTVSIAKKLGVQLTRVVLERFPDSELHVEVQEVCVDTRSFSFSRPARP